MKFIVTGKGQKKEFTRMTKEKKETNEITRRTIKVNNSKNQITRKKRKEKNKIVKGKRQRE